MSNFVQGSSDSLVIAEGRQEIQINSSEEKPKHEDDLFELSRDEPSLSFQIEEESKNRRILQICRQSKEDTLILNVMEAPQEEETKKRRKEIFDKFRKPQKLLASRAEEEKGDSNLLNIFDSIFSKKPADPAKFCGVFQDSGSRELIRMNMEEVSKVSRTPSAERRARLKIFSKKAAPVDFESVLPPNILQQSQKFPETKQTESQLYQGASFSPIRDYKKDESMNLQSIQKRISAIEMEDQDISRDSLQLGAILQAEIFRQEREQQRLVQVSQEKFKRQVENQPQPDFKNIPTGVTLSKEPQPFQKKEAAMIHTVRPVLKQSQISQTNVISPQVIKIVPQERQDPREIIFTNQIQETKYLNNDLSSISSGPSVCVQTYQNLQNSMVNVNKKAFNDFSVVRTEFRQKGSPLLHQNLLIQSQVIEAQKKIVVNHVFQEQTRLPLFLRKVRKHISVYPNFYILTNTPNTSEAIAEEFRILFAEMKKVLNFLGGLCQKVLEAKSKKQFYLEEIASTLSIESFLELGWVTVNTFQEEYELIRPKQPIDIRGWSFEKVKTALVNYENIVNYYDNKGIHLDLTSEKGIKKYFQIRQKFWNICGNLKLISEDIFCEMRRCQFPSHYYQFYSFLKSSFPARLTEERLTYVRRLMSEFRYQLSRNDMLVNCAIGEGIRRKLELQLRYLCPY